MSAAADGSSRGVWREVADRVFVRRYAFYDQTIPVVLGDGVALVVDTRSTPSQARELLADLRRLDPRLRPIQAGGVIVVNSHHHYDHTFGNSAFRPAMILGHERCPARMRERSEAARARVSAEMPELAAELAEVAVDPPDRTFAESQRLDVGGRQVELRYLGRGHPDDDVVTLVADVPVILAGDLVEQGAPPSFGDSYPLEWPSTLASMLDLAAAALFRSPVIVPGHGEPVGRDFVEAQLADIAALAERARRAYDSGGRLEDLVRDAPFPEPYARIALERAFAQLDGSLG